MRHTSLTLLSAGIVKQAATDPQLSAALQGGLMGAAGGGTIQLLRRLFQSKRDEEENGSPSILNGLLLGGLGGAGLGYGLGGMGGQQEAPTIWGDMPPGSIEAPTPGIADAAFPPKKEPNLGLPDNPAATPFGGVSMGDAEARTQFLPPGAVNAMGNPFANFK